MDASRTVHTDAATAGLASRARAAELEVAELRLSVAKHRQHYADLYERSQRLARELNAVREDRRRMIREVSGLGLWAESVTYAGQVLYQPLDAADWDADLDASDEDSYDGEHQAVLWLTDDRTRALAQRIKDDIDRRGKYLAVRYWITDAEVSEDERTEAVIRAGAGEARVGDQYSEITGYLWTDEKINVGGHDLISEIRSAVTVGKWLHLEVSFSREAAGH